MTAVRVTLIRDRIYAKFPYSAVDNEAAEQIGGRYSKAASAFTFKLSMEACRDLRAMFGDRLVIAPPLRAWAWEQRRKHEQLELLRNGVTPDDALCELKSLAPTLFNRLMTRQYQVAGSMFALTGGNILLGDQPGLGKTYQALGAVVASRAKRILIISPRTAVRSVWENHIHELCPFMTPVVAQGSRAKRQAAIAEYNCRVDSFKSMDTNYAAALVINKEMIRVKRMWQCDTSKTERGPEFSKPPGRKGGCPFKDAHAHIPRYYPEYPELFGQAWDYIVMDEAHHALASRYNVQSYNITQIRLGAMRLPLADDGRKLAMSGTPYRSKAQKAWGTLNWLQPKQFSSFWSWAEALFAVNDGAYAREVSQKPRDPETFADHMRPYLLARTKAEVAPELPPIEYAGTTPDGSDGGPVGIWLDMEPEQAKAYRSMVEMAEANLTGGRITATGVLAELTRLRQFACSFGELDFRSDSSAPQHMTPSLPSNKYDWLLDFMREREGFGGKVIVASQFTGLLRMMANALYNDMDFTRADMPLMLHGGTSDRQREVFQSRIQDPSDPAWIGFLNMNAGGEAITLDQADDMIVLDNPWIDDTLQQLENRLHRISRIHQVTVYRLQSAGTVEQSIAELTDEQRSDLMALRPAGRKILSGLFE